MQNIMKIDNYDEKNDFKLLFPDVMFSQEISGRLASWCKLLLKTRFSYIMEMGIKRSMNFDSFTRLEIEDEPTVLPLKHYEHIKPIDADFSLKDLKKILIKKNKWSYPTISTYYEGYLNKEITPFEIATKIIKICQTDTIKKYNSIVEMHHDDILKAATESTERYEKGSPLSVVDGVPFFVKEHIYIDGYTNYLGLSAFGRLRKCTAFSVKKLLDAGAILIGTTSMSALDTNNIGVNTDPLFSSPQNPWNNERYSGGGSTGNAVLLALGLCPFAIASDTIGSIRVPSGWCGIVGIRPTFSRVSNTKCLKRGYIESYLTIGVMGCCVADTSIILHIISGPDKDFPIGLNQPQMNIPNFNNFSISKIRFGFYQDYINLSERSIINCLDKVIKFLKDNGCLISDIVIPEIINCTMAMIIDTAIELPSAIDYLQKYSNLKDFVDISLELLIAFGKTLTKENKINSQKQRTRMIKIVDSLFEKIDIFILPTTSRLAPVKTAYHKQHGFLDHDIFVHSFHYSALASLTGIPSISLNVGYDDKIKLPLSIQLISKWWSEDILFSVANFIENNFPLTEMPVDFQKIL